MRIGWWKRRWRPGPRVVEYHFLPAEAVKGILARGPGTGIAICGEFIGGKAPPGPPEPWTRASGPAAMRFRCETCLKRLEEAP